MRVIQVSTMDMGGAYQAAHRLHKGLLLQNIQSTEIILHQYEKNLLDKTAFLTTLSPFLRLKYAITYRLHINLIQQKLRRLPKAQFSFADSPYNIMDHALAKQADIIHLHWVANFLNYRSFFRSVKKPVVWTLHDENPFSGGFHYEYYQDIAYNALNQEVLEKKSEAIKGFESLTVVSPSQWLLNKSQNSIFGKFRHVCIPYGVDTNIFKPMDKETARRHLELPIEKKIVLFVADDIKDKRKGLIPFLAGLDKIEIANTIFCVAGKNDQVESIQRIFKLPFIHNKEQMAKVYNAADVFVIPSLADNFPNTVLEAMACGLPVIGFDTGGIPEMVQNGQSGWLVKVAHINDLFERLICILENGEMRKSMGIIARTIATEKYTLEKQALAYQTLYKEVI